jgi:hypothetical protein
MGVAPFLWRTIRTQRYRTQQTAKPQQTGKMTLGTVPAAGWALKQDPDICRLNVGPRR